MECFTSAKLYRITENARFFLHKVRSRQLESLVKFERLQPRSHYPLWSKATHTSFEKLSCQLECSSRHLSLLATHFVRCKNSITKRDESNMNGHLRTQTKGQKMMNQTWMVTYELKQIEMKKLWAAKNWIVFIVWAEFLMSRILNRRKDRDLGLCTTSCLQVNLNALCFIEKVSPASSMDQMKTISMMTQIDCNLLDMLAAAATLRHTCL